MAWKETIRAIPARWLLIAASVLLVLAWLRWAPPTAPWSPQRILASVMPEPKVITKIEKVTVPGPERIKVIPKTVIVERWRDLPTPATVADNAAVVTAIADIPPSPEGGTAISVLRTVDNTATGSIEYQPKAIPFLKVKREFAVYGGILSGGGVEVGLVARPLRIGPVEVIGRGFLTTGQDGSTRIQGMAGIEYRF